MKTAAQSKQELKVVWQPQPGPQAALVRCPVFEVFFGGARGGGKTDGMLGDWLIHSDQYGAPASGLMVRRTSVQLRKTFERFRAVCAQLGARSTEVPMTITMPSGAKLVFAYLESDRDAENYQGHGYTRVYVEELTNFPNSAPVLKLMACLRSGDGVPVGFRATGNPGGPGHHWVKARYIDPAPLGWNIITSEFTNPFTSQIVSRDRVFIPSKLNDNQYLGDEYVANLLMSGNKELVRAWLEGDWSVVAGAFFPEFSINRHVIEPFIIPAHWVRFRAMDWGSAAPFSVGWYAVSDGTVRGVAKSAIVKYREWYGSTGEPNVGLRLTAEQLAEGISLRDRNEKIDYGVADPSMFAQNGGPSLIERIMLAGSRGWRRADNTRVGRDGSAGGWDQIRSRLIGSDWGPGLLLFSTCVDSIRTIPVAQHDPDNVEDMLTTGEDHALDEIRYACLSRPYVRIVTAPEQNQYVTATGPSPVPAEKLWGVRPRGFERI